MSSRIYSHAELTEALEVEQGRRIAAVAEADNLRRQLALERELSANLAALVDSLRSQRDAYAAYLQSRDPALKVAA